MIVKGLRTGICIILLFAMLLSMGGVLAVWTYAYDPETKEGSIVANANSFKYGYIYITETKTVGGSYQSAESVKKSETSVDANVKLHGEASSNAVIEVTFYNSTDVSYYYDTTEEVTDSQNVDFSVSGIAQKDEIPSKTYKTITLTFSYNSQDTSDTNYLGTLNFKFTLDKDSIGNIVAHTITGKFEEILNGEIASDSYNQLTEAMNSRGTGYNAGSSITYIGNVAGAASDDSQAIVDLFGTDAFNMDLDGDGNTEPVTIMVKRENLDDNTATGDSYSYQNWRGETITVHGNEMTIYITAESFSNTSRGDSVVVYASIFTKNPESEEWVQIVPLTKGTADANNYEGSFFGSANSFNTDTWVDENRNTVETLVRNALDHQ